MTRLSDLTTAFPPDPQFKPRDEDAAVVRRMDRRIEGLVRQVNELVGQLNDQLDIGNPGLGAIETVKGNLAGGWVSAVVTAGGVVLFTHNLNLPVVAVAGRAYNQCNVSWLARFVYGDRTGANAAPAAPAVGLHSSVFFRLGDAVTANTIELRVHSELTLAAATPLNVDIRFFPAIV